MTSGSTEVEVLLKAIASYEMALVTKLKDQSLAILDGEKFVANELTGI